MIGDAWRRASQRRHAVTMCEYIPESGRERTTHRESTLRGKFENYLSFLCIDETFDYLIDQPLHYRIRNIIVIDSDKHNDTLCVYVELAKYLFDIRSESFLYKNIQKRRHKLYML